MEPSSEEGDIRPPSPPPDIPDIRTKIMIRAMHINLLVIHQRAQDYALGRPETIKPLYYPKK